MRKILTLLAVLLTVVSVVEAKKTESSPKTAPIKVACVGNSITYGATIDHREQNCYPAQLQTMLGPKYVVGNFGRNGTTLLEKGHSPYFKSDVCAEALAMAPDAVVIHLGINDTDPGDYARYREDFVGDYVRLIERFRKVNPDVKIYIARLTPIPHRHHRFVAGVLDWYNKIQKDIVKVADSAKVYLIDFNEPLYRRPDLLPDALHPNAEGAQLLAKTVACAITGNYGGLRLPLLYGNNMVLQRCAVGETTKIEGTASRDAKVLVALSNGMKAETKADYYGNWSVGLPLDKVERSLTLNVESEGKLLQYCNVAVGQVWVLSGQSNMSWSVAASTSPVDARLNDQIRLYRMTPEMNVAEGLSAHEMNRLNELDFIGADGWKSADNRATVDQFSAIGYYFAQALFDSIDEPIGLIQTSLGGAPAEAFVSRNRLENNAEIRSMLYDPHNNMAVMPWCREVMAASLGDRKGTLQRHPFEAAYLYESRLYPLRNFPISGVLWHQGESNAHYAEMHERLFAEVVATFRDVFAQPKLPFYFVQLAELTDRPDWTYFRESQAKMADAIENCEMVVSRDYSDLNDVHPRVKRPIGERLAGVALRQIYNKK